jgi:hypothetical protein
MLHRAARCIGVSCFYGREHRKMFKGGIARYCFLPLFEARRQADSRAAPQ